MAGDAQAATTDEIDSDRLLRADFGSNQMQMQRQRGRATTATAATAADNMQNLSPIASGVLCICVQQPLLHMG